MKEPSEEVKRVEQRYEKALDDMEKHYKDVLEQIRAEIEDCKQYQFETYGIQRYFKIDDIRQIIDKYMK